MESIADHSSESLLRAHHAAASHALRYSAVHTVRIDGWLAKEGKAFRTRRSRYVRLNGHILSSHRARTASPSWHVSVTHAIVQKGSHPREIKLVLPHRVISFLAPTQHAYEKWIVALRRATLTSSSVEDYYRIGRLIGEGMNGQVRLAHDLLTDEQVAVKMVPRLGRENETQFLAREVQIILSVSHPNIVRTIDVFVRTRRIHFVMEYLAGGELFDFIAENTQFTETHAASVMSDLLHALSYLHARRIAHRDVKLENLLCANTTWPLNVKLADFGFANYVSATGDPVLSSFVGTPYYIAPEMLRGNPHGCPVDIWASGVVMYILLSGKFPFGGKNESEYYQRVLTKEAYFPSEEWSNVSDDAKDLVRGMLCKNPEKRLTAEQCLHHPWLRRAEAISEQLLEGELFPVDPVPDIATESATFSTIDASLMDGVGHSLDTVMVSAPIPPLSGVPTCDIPENHGNSFPTQKSSSGEKQHFLRSPDVFRDNREKKGKWRYLGMLNHSLSGPTEEVMAARRPTEKKCERKYEKRADKKGCTQVEASTRATLLFDDTLVEASPQPPPVHRRPSLIRRLLSSGKLSLDRYDGRFSSARGDVDEQADEATATPRKTYSLFSKDGPLRRSFHRGGEHRIHDDGINFVNSQSQRLPPKIARERQRQQKQVADALRKSARGGGIFTHLKVNNGSKYNNQHNGYHSSPRLQMPLVHPFSSMAPPPGERSSGTTGNLLDEVNAAMRRLSSTDICQETGVDVNTELTGFLDYNNFQTPSFKVPTEEAAVKRAVSANGTPVDRLPCAQHDSSQDLFSRA